MGKKKAKKEKEKKEKERQVKLFSTVKACLETI